MKQTINERFTDLADIVSQAMGQWWVTAISIAAVLLWLAVGPIFHFSDTWQLLVNTPTTILEMWIGFLLAAAANRVEKRNREINLTMQALLAKEEAEEQTALQKLDKIIEWQGVLLKAELQRQEEKFNPRRTLS